MRKAIFVSDSGIDGAFALALALLDPNIEVLGIAATAGIVDSEQATRNVHVIIEQVDPPRWPRVGAGLSVDYEINGANLHGAGGLGGANFPCAELHHPHPSDRLLVDLIRLHKQEVTVVLLGPATVLARAFDRDPELVALVERVIVVGGTWHHPGNATAMAEFNFFCDPAAARQVLQCGVPILLLPLDLTSKLVFAPAELLALPAPHSRCQHFLSEIVPFGIRATASLFGIEGVQLHRMLGTVALSLPQAITTKTAVVDVETRGELTRGVSVFDARWNCTTRTNVELGVDVDLNLVRNYFTNTLSLAR